MRLVDELQVRPELDSQQDGFALAGIEAFSEEQGSGGAGGRRGRGAAELRSARGQGGGGAGERRGRGAEGQRSGGAGGGGDKGGEIRVRLGPAWGLGEESVEGFEVGL